jgi:hypothetical protein
MTSAQPIDVLLVEDDAGDEMITREAFQQNKIANTLHVARDGAEGLDFLYRRGEHHILRGALLDLPATGDDHRTGVTTKLQVVLLDH